MTWLHRSEPDDIYNLAGHTSVWMTFAYPVETFVSILIGTMILLECMRLLNKGLLKKANQLRCNWSQRLEADNLAGNAAIADCCH